METYCSNLGPLSNLIYFTTSTYADYWTIYVHRLSNRNSFFFALNFKNSFAISTFEGFSWPLFQLTNFQFCYAA